MNSSISGLLLSSMMGDRADFSDQSSLIFELWNKYQKSSRDLYQVNELCELLTEIKQNINSNATVEDLERVCKQHQSQKWVDEFIQNLSSCTTTSTASGLDPERANASLIAGFDRTFVNAFGIQMLLYSSHSLFQSYMAWNLINSLHIPSYNNHIRRSKEKLDQCAIVCSPLLDLPIFNSEQIRKLHRVQE